MRSKSLASLALGFIFIFCGGIWLVGNLFNVRINFNYIWPLFIFTPGLFFVFAYFRSRRHDWGVLIPGTILIVTALTFYFNVVVGDLLKFENVWVLTSFMYPGAVAIAFVVASLASKKKELLIPAAVVGFVSLATFCFSSFALIIGDPTTSNNVGRIFWPFVMICGGVFILLSPFAFRLPFFERRSRSTRSDIEEAEIVKEEA